MATCRRTILSGWSLAYVPIEGGSRLRRRPSIWVGLLTLDRRAVAGEALSYRQMMAAYIVGRLQVTHLDWVGEYIPKVSKLISEHGGRFLVRRGDPVQIEGDEPAPDAAIIIEFPDRDTALRFWNSPEFAPLVELRQTGSHMEATLLDGFS
jgi:uncharacterized protein (DUF1330 family)